MFKEFIEKETKDLRELFGMIAVPERIEQILKEKGYVRVVENWYVKGSYVLILMTTTIEDDLFIINAVYLDKLSNFKEQVNSKIGELDEN